MDWDIAAHKKRELQKSACASFERSEKQTAMVKRLFGLNILGADSERNEEERTPQAQVIFNPWAHRSPFALTLRKYSFLQFICVPLSGWLCVYVWQFVACLWSTAIRNVCAKNGAQRSTKNRASVCIKSGRKNAAMNVKKRTQMPMKFLPPPMER